MGLRDVESRLPPGFRFHPSDEELVCHYLAKKVVNEKVSEGTLVEVDLHIREPWELPEAAKLSANEWYFFSFRDRKYATGSRTNRATKTGYWKATGKDRIIYNPCTHSAVGMRKTLVFYRGRAPNGIKTGWVMHEFRLETPHSTPKEDWVLCRVVHKMKGETTSTNMNMEEEYEQSDLSPPCRQSAAAAHQPLYTYEQQEICCYPLFTSNITSNGNNDAANFSNNQQQQEDLISSSNSFHYSNFFEFHPQEVDSSCRFAADSYGFLMEDMMNVQGGMDKSYV